MDGLQVNGYPVRMHQLQKCIGDLLADALRHGETPSEQPN
jgi:hypothetical protein